MSVMGVPNEQHDNKPQLGIYITASGVVGTADNQGENE